MQLDLSLGNFPIRQQLLLLALLILGGFFFFFAYIKPLRITRDNQQHQIAALQLEVQQGKGHRKRLPALRDQLRQQRRGLQHFQQILPNKKETAQLMDHLQHLAVESRLQVKSFSPQQTVSHGFYAAWPIIISLEGNYHNLGHFLELVANNPRLVSVGDLTISALEGETNRDRTIVATCTAKAFMLEASSGSPP